MTRKIALAITSTSPSGYLWDGHVAPYHQLVRPGHKFTGREGWMGKSENEVSTGWHTPAKWYSEEELLAIREECLRDAVDEEVAEMIRTVSFDEYFAEPEDFPGLKEFYPEFLEEHDELV